MNDEKDDHSRLEDLLDVPAFLRRKPPPPKTTEQVHDMAKNLALKDLEVGERSARRFLVRYHAHLVHLLEQAKGDILPRVQRLIETWNVLEKHQGQRRAIGDGFIWFTFTGEDGARNLPETVAPVELIVQCIDAGYYPPPELMLVLTSMFRQYIAGAGEESLETFMFGKPARGKGGYATQKVKTANNEREYKDFEWFIERQDRFTSLRAAAVAYVDSRKLPISGRSLEARLRRHGGKRWMRHLQDVIERKRRSREATK